jgi:hypothetical protein
MASQVYQMDHDGPEEPSELRLLRFLVTKLWTYRLCLA